MCFLDPGPAKYWKGPDGDDAPPLWISIPITLFLLWVMWRFRNW